MPETLTAPTHPLLEWLHTLWGVDAEWSVADQGSFTWWPSQYAQHVRLLPTQRSGAHRLQARTTLVLDVRHRAEALQLLSALNSGSAGSAFHLDDTGTHLYLDTTHTVPDGNHEQRALFAHACIVQAIVAHHVGTALADAVGGTAATSSHPTSGSREVPDEMLTLLQAGWARPEQMLGTALTTADITLLAHRIAAAIGTQVGQGDGDVWLLDDDCVAAFDVHFEPPGNTPVAHGRPTSIFVGLARHPDLGDSFSVHVGTPLTLAQPDTAEPLADQLNRAAAQADDDRTGLGAWWSREGQLCWSTYIPLDIAPALAPSGHPARADQLATLVGDLAADRSAEAASAACALGLQATGEPQPWAGLQHEVGRPLSVFPDRIDARLQMVRQLRDEPETILDVPLADLGPIPHIELGRWGIFNPAGPTLTTLGLLATQEGFLLAEWMRHPFGPLFRVHAVLDDLTDDAVRDACQRVMVDSYGDPDRCPVPRGLPEFVFPPDDQTAGVHARDALLTIGEKYCPPADLAAAAAIYDAFAGDVWARMNALQSRYDQITSDVGAPSPREAAQAWWRAASDLNHVAGHAVSFSSAWDGAVQFLHTATSGEQSEGRA